VFWNLQNDEILLMNHTPLEIFDQYHNENPHVLDFQNLKVNASVRGSFGVVYSGIYTLGDKSDLKVAVKNFLFKDNSQTQFETEYKILQ
jgi:hypothetical protein